MRQYEYLYLTPAGCNLGMRACNAVDWNNKHQSPADQRGTGASITHYSAKCVRKIILDRFAYIASGLRTSVKWTADDLTAECFCLALPSSVSLCVFQELEKLVDA